MNRELEKLVLFGFQYGIDPSHMVKLHKGLEKLERTHKAEPKLPHPLRGGPPNISPLDFIEQLSYDTTAHNSTRATENRQT